MKIILDESVPQKLRLLIQGHSVVTVAYQGWSGSKNGALLTTAEQAGYELFITADQEIRFQQNLTGRAMAILVLSTNNWDQIRESITNIIVAINSAAPSSYTQLYIPLE